MKRLIMNGLMWLYTQLYVTFAVLFLSKKKLFNIAVQGGNHPLIVFESAKWTRVWWFSITGFIVWIVLLVPFFNLLFRGDFITFYSEITRDDTIIFFNMFTFDFGLYIVLAFFGGKLLQLIELITARKMNYFKRHINYENYYPNRDNMLEQS